MKTAFIQLELMGKLQAETPHHRFAFSTVGIWIARYGCELITRAFNHRTVAGDLIFLFSICLRFDLFEVSDTKNNVKVKLKNLLFQKSQRFPLYSECSTDKT